MGEVLRVSKTPFTRRQRVLAAIRHQPVDRLPTDMWATDEVRQKLFAHFQVDTTIALYDALGIDGIFGIAPPYIGPAPLVKDDYWEDAWRMGYRKQVYPTGTYSEQVHFPLAGMTTIAELKAFPWPSPDYYDYSALPALAAQYPERAIMCGYTAVFYWHNKLRGLELSLMDPLADPDLAHYIVERVSDFFDEYHRRCFAALRGIVDITQVTDDFGSQHGLLISPTVFEQFYRKPMQRAIDLAKSHGIIVFHHDDGDLRPLLPTLVEMGIEILNPIQWRCGDWNLAALKRDVGGRICFHGAVDNQHTLPFGTPDEVRAEVKRLVETLGSDRTGFIIAPCHNLQANTSIENIIAMYQAAREFGVA
jgi:uroporphyrinogen decarboxylase